MRFLSTRARVVRVAALAAALTTSGCTDFLDVNTNPNAPQVVSANLYLAPMLHWMVTAPQYDGRFVGRYTQQWTLPGTVVSTWDRMGYDPSSDNGAQQWRDVYWTLGQNLVDMMGKAEAEQRWDLLGVGKILKAWGWQVTTDLHGEIIVKEAIDQSKFSFNYDTQEYAYQEIQKLLNEAITLLARTDGAVDQTYLARTDRLYGGDRARWTKLAWAMMAVNLNHYTNKGTYKPADVIAAVDKSFASNADELLLPYPATQNDDINFWGRTRGNITNYRQTRFVLGLLNGTVFGGVVDPRLSRMLSPSPDGQYRGLDPNVTSFGALTTAQRPNNFHGYADAGGTQQPGRYIFDDKAKLPVITYAELQFIKAEAAYRMGNKGLALSAYTAGVGAHLDWVNARNSDNGQSPTQITSAERNAFLASPAIVPTSAAALTLTQIMSQKYIALWGWGHNEIWMDMRRYHYTDVDPASGQQVYPGFALPTSLYPDNGGKAVERIRPRFNSEYVWNRAALETIGGLAPDYHTKPMWIITP
ncbi:MAG: RagB/SusD family nutrient uptake outer membrane protein [Gemmatimonadaceae bacterium]|nr:RagB/SusD family nutrient uptake outer membrane protein [Gemmatimonadaceae bacterium]